MSRGEVRPEGRYDRRVPGPRVRRESGAAGFGHLRTSKGRVSLRGGRVRTGGRTKCLWGSSSSPWTSEPTEPSDHVSGKGLVLSHLGRRPDRLRPRTLFLGSCPPQAFSCALVPPPATKPFLP